LSLLSPLVALVRPNSSPSVGPAQPLSVGSRWERFPSYDADCWSDGLYALLVSTPLLRPCLTPLLPCTAHLSVRQKGPDVQRERFCLSWVFVTSLTLQHSI
jgi:hypothetical protein